MTWSLRRRLGVTVVAVAAVGLVVMAVALYIAADRSAREQRDRSLATRARALTAIAEREGDSYEMVLPPPSPEEPASYIEVWKPDASVLLRSDTLHSADLAHAIDPNERSAFEDVVLPDGRAGRAVTLRFEARDEVTPPPGSLMLVLAEGTESIEAAIARLRATFLIVGVVSLLSIAAATQWVMARGTRPLAHLVQQIEGIGDRQLSSRVSLHGQPAELEVPIRKLNELLARLEASFAREREFSANVSHELRTPLAGLRTLLEVTALGDSTVAEYRKMVGQALTAVGQLCAMVENLLALAQADAGVTTSAATDIELDQLVDECWAAHRALAASRQLAFCNAIPARTAIRSDREMLRIVVSNLLANAAEYTEHGGRIEVSLHDGALEVTDSGPAIPAADLERVFDRLWRGDRARSGDGAHCGIGLALSRSLCATLSLSLSAHNANNGSVTFRIAPRDGVAPNGARLADATEGPRSS
jgi:signal transduction histidine kinase